MTARRTTIRVVLRTLLAATLLLGPASPAMAARDSAPAQPAVRAIGPSHPAPTLGLSDGGLLVSADPARRAGGIAVARQAGARFARFPIGWSTVVRNETFTRPSEATVSLSDPAHPTYRWERIDAALRDQQAAGLTPIAYLMAAPPWAQSAPRYAFASGGTWAPRPADVAAFASAIARRYDGTYPDPQRPGQALPRIRYFQTWNEPNLARYLQPQWIPGQGGAGPQLFGARWYRRMHAAAYAAIHARQPDAKVGLAGLAPTGDGVDGGARVGPMRFLRSVLCVGITGPTCGGPLPFDAVALHPLSTSDPDRPAKDPDDLAVADLQPKLAAVLDQARHEGRLVAGSAPELWVTELNWTANAPGGVLTAQQAAVVGRGLLRLQQAGASLVNWQFASDPDPSRTGGADRPAGLTLAGPGGLPGAPKPFLAGFAFPTAAIAVGRDQAYVWGIVPAGARGAGARASVVVSRRRGARWERVATLRARADGTVSALLPIARGVMVRLRAGATLSTPVRAQLRLGAVLSSRVPSTGAGPGSQSQATASLGVRAQSRGPVLAPDPRPGDDDGPGAFPPFPPVMPGGTPASPGGRPTPTVDSPVRLPRRLRFTGTGTGDVIVGSSGADRLDGLGGDDLLIGLGGDDRFDPGTGRDTVVRSRVVSVR